MIRINLAPKEELESQLWFLPELILMLVVGFVVFTVVALEMSDIKDNIATVTATRNDFNEKAKLILPKLERFKTLGKDKESLMVKLRALQMITDSKLAKYRPLIAIEHLQNLKPESVWLSSLTLVEENKIEFDAFATDNILVAEFISALKSTQFQDTDPSDLRTQIYFSQVVLSGTSAVEAMPGQNAASGESSDGSGTVRFKLTLTISERTPAAPAPTDKQARSGRDGGWPWTQES